MELLTRYTTAYIVLEIISTSVTVEEGKTTKAQQERI